jgi:hypothetical protein
MAMLNNQRVFIDDFIDDFLYGKYTSGKAPLARYRHQHWRRRSSITFEPKAKREKPAESACLYFCLKKYHK